MLLKLSETALPLNTAAKTWTPAPGRKWRVVAAWGDFNASAAETGAQAYAGKQPLTPAVWAAKGDFAEEYWNTGPITSSKLVAFPASYSRTLAAAGQPPLENPYTVGRVASIVTTDELLTAYFNTGVVGDTYDYWFIVDETPDDGEEP